MVKCKSKEGVELLFLEVKAGSSDFTIINEKFYYKNRKGKIKFIKKILPKDFSGSLPDRPRVLGRCPARPDCHKAKRTRK